MKYAILCLMVLSIIAAHAQKDSLQPPYKRFPGLPPVNILLSDSSTMYGKSQIPQNKPVLFMLFSPECSHCQHETEDLVAHKEQLKDIQIVMITMQPLNEMKEFISRYKLNEMANVVVGKDIYYTTPSFFNIHNLPFLAMYDNRGSLITVFEGSLPMENIIHAFGTKENKSQ